MQRTRSISSSLVIGLTLLVLGSITTASKAGAPAGAQGSSSDAALDLSALSSSSAEQLRLSKHLKATGALFYGAWWCPACAKQKALFGKEGAASLPYVECDKKPDDREVCIAAQVKAFPTWELKGKQRLVGVQSLAELKVWSAYKP